MLSRAFGLLFCVVGLLLPHRLRIWFSEFLGWATQGVYYLYYGLMNYLLTELRQADDDRKHAVEPGEPDVRRDDPPQAFESEPGLPPTAENTEKRSSA